MVRVVLVVIALAIVAYLLGFLRFVHLHISGAVHWGHVSLTTLLIIVLVAIVLALALRR